MKKMFQIAAIIGFATAFSVHAASDMPFPGPVIGRTVVAPYSLGNNVITATFEGTGGSLRLARLQSALNGLDIAWSDKNLFSIYLTGKPQPLASSAMKCETSGGIAGGAVFTDEATGLRAEWRPVITDGANYLRMTLTLAATRGPVAVDRIEMVNASLDGARVSGPYDGMPVITDKLFLGVEHPMSKNLINDASGWSPAEMNARAFALPLTDIKAGALKVRFQYQGGNHGITVDKVVLADASGKTVAEDAHEGFCGHKARNNSYTLAVPTGLASGSLKVTIGGPATETDSSGKVIVEGAKVFGSSTVSCSFPRHCELKPGTPWTTAIGIGVFPAGQLRRAFLYYLERERAHPYRQYWHYNSWYDLNIDRNDNPDPLKRMTEAQCLDVINAFQKELYEKHGVGLNGFVWDDGWDDWNTLWGFHKGFPNGFAKLKEAAAKQGAGMGAWLSPWGGYGGSKNRRVAYGKSQGFETNATGFSLGGPKYYAAFRGSCLMMIRKYNQNYFKFDGIGGGTWATGAAPSVAPDLDALSKLNAELRKANPEVFINCTVGTWPSPYWVFFADSIWRGGADCDYAGAGNPRERWITYRDSVIGSRFVAKAPLYPLNSIMYHGLLVGPRSTPAPMPWPGKNIQSFWNEITMSVGCGSGLGELYVTPSIMTPEAWKMLADALKWCRARKEILRDTHWVSGEGGVYGYASWHPTKGATVVIRNPGAQPQTFTLNPQEVFELPAGAAQNYAFTPALGTKADAFTASPAAPVTLTLQPFQVMLFDAAPAK